ncbi:MAG: dihydrolipoyl dehydrogenase [Fimbriimonadaceae bacterium]
MRHKAPASNAPPENSVATNGPATAPVPTVVDSSLIASISEIHDGGDVGIEEQAQKMPNDNFDADIVVIGSGPGGYVAAIRAAQLGAKVVCVEDGFLGGTCLNWGCIPSKALIASVERLNHAKHADKLGIKGAADAVLDFGAVIARKEKIVLTQRSGVGLLFKKNGVRHIDGFARFKDAHTIEVTKDGKVVETLTAKNVVLAMGSSVIRLDIPGLKGGKAANVWTSDEAVNAPFAPKRMLILGGGAVGVEFAYVFNGMGSEVTVVEMMPSLIPLMDSDLGADLAKSLGRQGIGIRTGSTLEKCERKGQAWVCHVKKGTDVEKIEVDVVLLGVGRKANVDGMNLDKVGVQLHRRGVQTVDDTLVTHAPHVYAIGDVRGHIQLAHVASAEGICAVQNILQRTHKKMDYKAVPSCVYTVPEVASVGLSQSEAEAQGFDVSIGKFGFRANGKAMAIAEQDGFVKVVCDKKYGEVLGVHMIGPHVTDMIHEGVVALKLEATLDYMIETIHAHPTLSEVTLEAFEDAAGHAIHKL